MTPMRSDGSALLTLLGPDGKAIVVVSAMGKTTNAFEDIWRAEGQERTALWERCVKNHAQVVGLSRQRGLWNGFRSGCWR